jgi:Fic family protein
MAMFKADQDLQKLFPRRKALPISKYIEEAVQLHHRLTVIHPYADGNGRTLRAFLNVMLVRAQITPLYIKVDEKDDYLNALEHADLTGDYTKLYIVVFQILLRRNAELCS